VGLVFFRVEFKDDLSGVEIMGSREKEKREMEICTSISPTCKHPSKAPRAPSFTSPEDLEGPFF
jgi:hypothetical protein